eukprot:3731483-Pyramimonas_sp.AAC.1
MTTCTTAARGLELGAKVCEMLAFCCERAAGGQRVHEAGAGVEISDQSTQPQHDWLPSGTGWRHPCSGI